MKTARDLLLLDVLALTKHSFSGTSLQSMMSLLDRYRVQAKPSTALAAEQTARQALGNELTACWQRKEMHEFENEIKTAIDHYRMQLKRPEKGDSVAENGKGGSRKGRETASAVKGKAKAKPVTIPPDQQPAKAPDLAVQGQKNKEPISGGPQKRNRSRGQCPKCHSMGVVLARSYSGDEYFSCIYCGFQAYRAALDSELDLPLAAELLGRRFDEKDDLDIQE